MVVGKEERLLVALFACGVLGVRVTCLGHRRPQAAEGCAGAGIGVSLHRLHPSSQLSLCVYKYAVGSAAVDWGEQSGRM